ncbi:MAG: hypothetical protein JRH20_19370 [Deltaproteobacteria bacterium]|nr:hypothetical protein [Deltaproteobacteria bacterium]
MEDQFEEKLVRARALLGDAEADQGLWEANEALNQALRIRLDHAGAWMLKSQTLSALEDDPSALAAAEMAVRLAPQRADSHFVRATVLMDLACYDEALAALILADSLANEGDPLIEDIYYERGHLLEMLERSDEAVTLFEEGLERFPSSSLLRSGLEPLRRSRLRHRLQVIDGGLILSKP